MSPRQQSIIFFFSSRRRHTRSYGDWSSDVCSSDLILSSRTINRGPLYALTAAVLFGASTPFAKILLERMRSEERRVGKECRARWGREQWEKARWAAMGPMYT